MTAGLYVCTCLLSLCAHACTTQLIVYVCRKCNRKENPHKLFKLNYRGRGNSQNNFVCRIGPFANSGDFIKGSQRFLRQQSKAEIDDIDQCVFRPPFTQVIQSCWRCRQGCCVSGFIRCTLWDKDQLTPEFTCALNWKCTLISLALHSCLLSLTYVCVSLSSPLSSLFSHPSTLTLSAFHSSRLSPFYLILCSPLCYSSLSIPQEEPQSYLGYVGFGELKSHFTNSLSASPENSAGYLQQFHHSSSFVRWNDAHWKTFDTGSSFNANPLPASWYSSLPPLLSSLFFFPVCFFSAPSHILGFCGDVKEC